MRRTCAIFLFIISIFTFPAMAQVPKEHAHAGIRASFDLNTSTGASEMFDFGPGFSVGGIYYAPFGKITYFNVGLLFTYSTFKFEHTYSDIRRHYKGHLETVGIRMPIDIGFKFYQSKKARLSAYLGPHLYFDFSAREKLTTTKRDEIEKTDAKLNNSGLELGLAVGIAADLWRHFHIHAEGTYGLTRLGHSETIWDWNTNLAPNYNRAEISVGLGYNF